jgi:hypothetical protein
VGFYDRDRGVWVPSNNGKVVKLLDTDSDDIVDALDANGDNLPDDLDSDGSYDNEVAGLDDLAAYPPGSTFWRVSVSHFSPYDCNWPYGLPEDAIAPNPAGEPNADQQKDEEKDCNGSNASFVEERSRIFHEDIPIPGTDLTLHYASNRVQGYKTIITVPASSAVPNSLKNIVVKVEVAGRIYETVLAPLPNQKAEFEWDGLDNNRREVLFPLEARISVGFVYDSVYYIAGDFKQAFAQAGSIITGISSRQEVIAWKYYNLTVYPPKSKGKSIGAEGWTLSAYHHLNLNAPSILFKGDGTKINENAMIIDKIEEGSFDPRGIAIDAAGNLFMADPIDDVVLKVDTNGTVTKIAGIYYEQGYNGDGGLAINSRLYNPMDVAVNSFGELFIADSGNNRIRKVDANGVITTIAGIGGIDGYNGDEGPATAAKLNSPYSVTVSISGEVYIADSNNYRIRKVDTNGIITTIAGNGTQGYSGDGGPAIEAALSWTYGIALNASGEF